MPGRNAFATPTNVYPRNGAAVVFDSNDQFMSSFTNNSDSIAFVGYEFTDATTNEWVKTTYCRWFNSDTFAITSNRGDRYTFPIDKYSVTTGAELVDGYHYKYSITLYGCYPHKVAGGYTLQPNAIVTFASGEIYQTVSNRQFYIASSINKIEIPIYWHKPYVTRYPEVTENLIACCYMRIGHEKRMIISYDYSSGLVTVETPFSTIPQEGDQYFLDCNYICSSGSESEGSYDFYVRQNIFAEADAYVVPWGIQCESTYTHPNQVGLENYRFKIYSSQGDDYINGNVQNPITDQEGNTLTDNQHIPIETGITENIIHKRLIIGTTEESGSRVSSGEWGEITYYDSTTGIATINRAISTYPSSGTAYTIELDDRELIGDSDNCYSYHLHYNFPIYALGNSFQLETILTSYEKQTLDRTIRFTIPAPHLTYDYGQINNTYIIENNHGENNAVYLQFDPALLTDDRYFSIYRRESGKQVWRYLGFLYKQNTYIDYLAANNTKYDYMISRSVAEGTKSYDPANEYKAYEFNNAVTTNWDGWTITAIYPCENDYIDDTIENIKQKKSQSSPLESFVCNKKPYRVGDTWTFIADIESGDIVHNKNRTVHVGTSKYPVVTSGDNLYQSGSFTADLLTISCPSGELYDNIERVNKWIEFINDNCLFILKSDKGDVWIISISENTSRSYDESVIPILTKATYSWVEVEDADNIQIVEISNNI